MRGLFAAAAVAAAAGVGHARVVDPEPAPVTFEEVVEDLAGLRDLRLSPAGRDLLIGLDGGTAPSDGVPDRLATARAEVWPLGGGPPARLGAPGRPFAPHLCEPWSPSSRRIVGMTLVEGERRLATWDRRTGRITSYEAAPTAQCAWWVGERLVYPLAAPGHPTAGSSSRLGARLQLRRWEQAWAGRTEVTLHSANPDFPAPAPPPGGIGLADPRSGRATVLVRGDFHSMTPSPDGRWLAAAQYGASDPEALGRPAGRLSELKIFRLDGDGARAAVRLPGVDLDYQALAWSRDARRLLAGGRDRASGALGLWVIGLPGGDVRRLDLPPEVRLGAGPRGAYATLRPLGWVGDHPAFIAATAGGRAPASGLRADYGEGRGLGFRLFAEVAGRIVDLSDVAQQSVTAFAATPSGEALFVADGALWTRRPGGPARRISRPDLEVTRLVEARPSLGLPPVYSATDQRAAVAVRTADGGARQVVLDLASGAEVLEAPEGAAPTLSSGLDQAAAASARGWASDIRLAGGRSGTLTTLNAAWAGRPTGAVRRLTYRAGGRDLTGWVVLPPGYRGGRLPAIVWIYGGRMLGSGPPRDALPGRAPTAVFSGQLWAANGYAVVYPSTPLRPGADTDVPADLAEATVAAVDAAAAAGWVDPARVGLIGHSFGGYSTAAVLARRSDRFRAGIALSGPYDAVGGWGLRGPREAFDDPGGYGFASETRGKVEAGQIGLGAPPFAAPGAYVRASLLFAAPEIRAPLMLAVGDLDPGSTALTQSERFFAALARAGNPAVMVRYWGQGHVQDDPWAVRDQWRRFNAWFDAYVRPATPPAGPESGPASAAPRLR